MIQTWVLILATHVGYGSTVVMHDFSGKPACEFAARAAREVSDDAGSKARTWCVPKLIESKDPQ